MKDQSIHPWMQLASQKAHRFNSAWGQGEGRNEHSMIANYLFKYTTRESPNVSTTKD